MPGMRPLYRVRYLYDPTFDLDFERDASLLIALTLNY